MSAAVTTTTFDQSNAGSRSMPSKPGVGVGRADRRAVPGAGEHEVVGVLRLAGELRGTLAAERGVRRGRDPGTIVPGWTTSGSGALRLGATGVIVRPGGVRIVMPRRSLLSRSVPPGDGPPGDLTGPPPERSPRPHRTAPERRGVRPAPHPAAADPTASLLRCTANWSGDAQDHRQGVGRTSIVAIASSLRSSRSSGSREPSSMDIQTIVIVAVAINIADRRRRDLPAVVPGPTRARRDRGRQCRPRLGSRRPRVSPRRGEPATRSTATESAPSAGSSPGDGPDPGAPLFSERETGRGAGSANGAAPVRDGRRDRARPGSGLGALADRGGRPDPAVPSAGDRRPRRAVGPRPARRSPRDRGGRPPDPADRDDPPQGRPRDGSPRAARRRPGSRPCSPETTEVQAIHYVERVRSACDLWLEAGAVALRLSLGWAEIGPERPADVAVLDAERRLFAEREKARSQLARQDDDPPTEIPALQLSRRARRSGPA